MNKYGYVYCITNKYMPNICKIGYVNTDNKTSHDRAKELSRHTNCPILFDVEYDIKVKNPNKYEKRIHKKLQELRINKKREFFNCKPQDIIKYFNKDVLIKYADELNDFSDNYLTIYKKNNKIVTYNTFIYKSINEFYNDIYNLGYITVKISISWIYYLYITCRYIIKSD